MCGSCSVSLNTDYEQYYLNDANQDLIHLFKLCQKEPERFIKDSEPFFSAEFNTQESYYTLRKRYNESKDQDERAILFFYLGKHSFNGIVRYNQSNYFNVPFGSYIRPYYPAAEIRVFSTKFKRAIFSDLDFEMFIQQSSEITGQKSIYIDPPYLKSETGKPTFTQYTAAGFRLVDHQRLNQSLFEHRHHFQQILVSNHHTKEISDIYHGAVKQVNFRVPRTISANGAKRNSIREVLLTF
jgi:DNA adenine methylase